MVTSIKTISTTCSYFASIFIDYQLNFFVMSSKPFEPAETKFRPTSSLSEQRRTYTAIGLAMLLTFVSVMVYMISSLDEDEILTQESGDVELKEWHTYYVESESDLPECEEDTIGRLYYIESSEKFEACTSNGWITVDIKGADGAPGQDGSDGAPGQDGRSKWISWTRWSRRAGC